MDGFCETQHRLFCLYIGHISVLRLSACVHDSFYQLGKVDDVHVVFDGGPAWVRFHFFQEAVRTLCEQGYEGRLAGFFPSLLVVFIIFKF